MTREMDQDLSVLGQWVRSARVQHGLNQREFGRLLADHLGRKRPFSQAAISDLERGIKDEVIRVPLGALASVLHVSEEQLREGLPEEVIDKLNKRAGAAIIYATETPAHVLGTGSIRKPISPTEKLMLRRLEMLFFGNSVDRGIKARLVQIINSQMDIIEELQDGAVKS